MLKENGASKVSSGQTENDQRCWICQKVHINCQEVGGEIKGRYYIQNWEEFMGDLYMSQLFQLSCCCLVGMLGQEEAIIWQPGLALLLLNRVRGRGR